MSFNMDTVKSSEEEGIEKATTELDQNFSCLKDAPEISTCADQTPIDLKPCSDHNKLSTVNAVKPPDEGEMPLVDGNETTGKHRDKHKKKDKDREREKNKDKDRNMERSKSTKRKDKSKDKHSDRGKKESKRKNDSEEDKRTHDKHSEKDKEDNKRKNGEEEGKKTFDIHFDKDKRKNDNAEDKRTHDKQSEKDKESKRKNEIEEGKKTFDIHFDKDKRKNDNAEDKRTHDKQSEKDKESKRKNEVEDKRKNEVEEKKTRDKHSERDQKDNKRKQQEEEKNVHHRHTDKLEKDNKKKTDDEEEKKIIDKHSNRDKKDNKRKNDAEEEKKIYERHLKLERSHDRVRDDDMANRRREKRRADKSEKEHRWASKYSSNDKGYPEYESHRHDRYRDLSKSDQHKSSTKSDRDKEGKRSRPDSDQTISNVGKSLPGSGRSRSRWGRSPSPHQKDREDRDWSSRDKSEKDGPNRYRRSGLGGYSPRRRKSDAAVKTPSPPRSSPERKKPRAWDLPPTGPDTGVAVAMAAAQQAAALASVSSLVMANPALASVNLTQATRNLRRLYIGNVPATVSDGELLEFMNAAMILVNANHIPGTKPCINCMVNIEKSYAFAEFLTAEDATAGLAFDGITLHGTTLKIRRPRDYVPPPSGGLEYTSINDMVSNVVPDSPNKIFVGGICRSLSADKIKEIVTAFGQIKAYHWELRADENHMEAFAFVAYLDPSITLKACAGLNGLRLGTRVITVVQATPDANIENGLKKRPSYGVPEHAKTLIQTPTRILEFQNVITEEEALALTEAEFLEIEEDVRLECARFGTIKSTHVVKPKVKLDGQNGDQMTGFVLGAGNDNLTEQEKKFAEYIASVQNEYFQARAARSELVPNSADLCTTVVGDWSVQSDNTADILKTVEHIDVPDSVQSESNTQTDNLVGKNDEPNLSIIEEDNAQSDKLVPASPNAKEPSDSNGNAENLGNTATTGIEIEKDDSQQDVNADLGRVYIEFTREECACKAAHVLHGRLFGERKVVVSYFPLKTYQKKFGKGLGPRTHEEKQALALAAQEHLNTYLPDRDWAKH